MIDLTQLAESLRNVDFPAFRNMANANDLFRQTYDSAMSATTEYITNYTAVQTFNNSGDETTDSTRKRNALGTAFRSLKAIADQYDSVLSTAKSSYFTLGATPGLLFTNILAHKSCCLYFAGKYLHLDTKSSMIRAVNALTKGRFSTIMGYNAVRANTQGYSDAFQGWAMATQFFDYSVNAQSGAVLQRQRRIFLMFRPRRDISTTSGVFEFRVCVQDAGLSIFSWDSPLIQCPTNDLIENLIYAFNTIVRYYNQYIDDMLVYAPGTLGDFWVPAGNATVGIDNGVITVTNDDFTWDLCITLGSHVLPEDTTLLAETEARAGLIRSFMSWAINQ